MARTEPFDFSPGVVLYAELRSDTATKVTATETARGAGVDSEYVFENLSTEAYAIRLREGEEPASTDPVVGKIGRDVGKQVIDYSRSGASGDGYPIIARTL